MTDGNVFEFRISDKLIPVIKGGLLGFNQKMKIFRAVMSKTSDIISLQGVEHFQGRYTLTVGRQFINGISAIFRGHRFHPGCRMVLKILMREESLISIRNIDHRITNLTLI